MAIKTQIRLGAITGSLGTGATQINDQIAAAATGSMAAADLGTVLSHMAGAIKRIHGASSFSQAAAGEFAQAIKTDTINEKTGAAGVTIDGVLLKDGGVQIVEDGYVGTPSDTDLVQLDGSGHVVKLAGDAVLKVDTISESDSAAGVTVEGVLLKDNDIVIPNGSTIGSVGAATAMTIDASGIVAFVDDIKIKDGGTIGVASVVDALTLAANGDLTLKEDLKFADGKLLGSTTTADLVTVNANDVQIKTTKTLKVDVIGESGSGTGVTIDGVKLKDNDVVLVDGSTVGVSSAPTAMTIASTGIVSFVDDIIVKDGGTIGVTSAVDAMTVASSGIVTFKDDIIVKDGGTIGVTSAVDAMTVASSGIVTFKDDIKIKDGGTIGTASTPAAITIAANGKVTLSGDLDVDGTTTTVDTTNLLVKDKLITINDGGGDNSARGAGIEFEENGSIAGFIKTSADGEEFEFKVPEGGHTLVLDVNADKTLTVAGALSIEADSAINQDLTTDANAQFANVTATAGMAINAQGGLDLKDSDSSHYVRLRAPATVASNVTLTLPDDDGDSGEALLTNGSGVLTWGAPSAGSIAADNIGVGDDTVTISASGAANKGINIETMNGFAQIALTASMGIKLNPGGKGIAVMRMIGAQESKMAGFIMGANLGDDHEHLVLNATDYMHLSSSKGQFKFVGKSQYGAGQPFFLIASGAGSNAFEAHAILSASSGDLIIHGAAAAETARFTEEGAFKLAGTKKIEFASATAYINHDGTDLQLVDDADINVKPGANFLVDAGGNVILDAGSGEWEFKKGGTEKFVIGESNSGDVTLENDTSDKDIIFKVNDGGSAAEVFRLDGDVSALKMAANKQLMFGDAGEYIAGNGTDLTIVSSNHVGIDAAGVIALDATTSGGPSIFFRDAGNAGTTLDWQPSNSGDWSMEIAAQNKDFAFKVDNGGSVQDVAKFIGNGASFRMSNTKKLEFGSAAAYIQHDGTDLQLVDDADINIKPATDFLVDAGNDIILDAGSGEWEFKKGGTEKFVIGESNSGDVTLENDTSDKDMIFKINDGGSATEVFRLFAATSALRVASSKRLEFGGAATYAFGDGTNLTIGAGGNQVRVESALRVQQAGVHVQDTGGSDPSNPASGYGVFYVKGDAPYFKSDGGVVTNLSSPTVTGSHPTKVQYTVTGSHASGVSLNIASGQGYANWSATGGHGNAAMDYVDVYVNGQLLVSGTGGSLSGADYVLSQDYGNKAAKFSFKLESDDVVSVKRIRQA